MFTFSVVKKIGVGKYLCDDLFIIERIRKTNAVNIRHNRLNLEDRQIKNRIFRKNKNDKGNAS